MDWVDEIISALGLISDFKRGTGPPSGIDGRLEMDFDLSRCRALHGTRWWMDIPALSGSSFPDVHESVEAASKPSPKPAVSAFADVG
eukprot:9276415-Alexandrium_andersonii.AAC.1